MSAKTQKLTEGRLTVRAAVSWLISVIAISSVCAWLISAGKVGQGGMIFLIAAVCLISSVVCSAVYRSGGASGALIWAVLSAIPLLLGAIIEFNSIKTGYVLSILISNAIGCFLGVTFFRAKSYKRKTVPIRHLR